MSESLQRVSIEITGNGARELERNVIDVLGPMGFVKRDQSAEQRYDRLFAAVTAAGHDPYQLIRDHESKLFVEAFESRPTSPLPAKW